MVISIGLKEYFPALDDTQIAALEKYAFLLNEWNQKINLVSRKDTPNILSRHILSALAGMYFVDFAPGAWCLDVGTGGGIPGLPLAIAAPECRFTLLESIRKKIDAVKDMAGNLGLNNVRCVRARVEDHEPVYDYILGRAVVALPEFCALVEKNLKPGGYVVYWSGGDPIPVNPKKWETKVFELKDKINDDYFETKIIYLIKRLR